MRADIAYTVSLPVASTPSKLKARWELIALSAVVAVGAWLDAAALFASPYAVGADGYYYVLQVNELLSKGQFYFPTHTPLVLYVLAGVSGLTGDPVGSIKVISLVLHAALCMGIFALVVETTRSRWLGVAGSALAVISGAHLYMVAEYLKQLGAFVFLIWAGWCAMRALRARSKGWALLSAFLLLAASLSHRSAPALALVFTALVLVARFLAPGSVGRGYRLVVLTLLLLLWCSPILIASQPFVSLPEWLRSELLVTPEPPFSSAAALEQLIVIVATLATLALIFLGEGGPGGKIPVTVLGAFALLSLLVTVNPFLDYSQPMGLSWRLSTLAYIQAAVLVPGLIWLTGRSRRATLLIAAFVLPLIIATRSHSRPFSLRPEYVVARASLLKRLPLYRQRLGPNALVISPHGEQFVVTYALGVPSQQKWPEDSRSRAIYWLLHSVPPDVLRPSMLVIMKDGIVTQTIIAADADVRQQLERLPDAEQKWLLSNNPHLNELLTHKPQDQ